MSERELWLATENQIAARAWTMIKRISKLNEPVELRPYHQVPGYIEYILPSSIEFLVVNKFLEPQNELNMFVRSQSGDER